MSGKRTNNLSAVACGRGYFASQPVSGNIPEYARNLAANFGTPGEMLTCEAALTTSKVTRKCTHRRREKVPMPAGAKGKSPGKRHATAMALSLQKFVMYKNKTRRSTLTNLPVYLDVKINSRSTVSNARNKRHSDHES